MSADGTVRPLIKIFKSPIVSLSVSPNSVSENSNSPLVYSFTRNRNINNSLIVHFSVDGTAVNGVDYDLIDNFITFDIGVEKVDLFISPINNDAFEGNKTVVLTLLDDNNYVINTSNPVVGIITENDTLPSISLNVSPSSVLENSGTPLFYTFTRVGSNNSVTVNYSISGTAVNGVDYVAIGTSVNFGVGVTSVVVGVIPINNGVFGANKTVVLTLTTGLGYEIGTPHEATGIIVDDEIVNVAVDINSLNSVHESYGSVERLEYIFTKNTSLGVTEINFIARGDAVFGVDYSLEGVSSFNGVLGTIILDGVSTKSLIATPIYNPADSINKVLTIELDVGSYSIGTPNSANGTIISNPRYCPQDTTNSL